MERIIEHSGVVERVENDIVVVKITASGACGTCRAREACGMGESQEKFISVTTISALEYMPGDVVSVGVQRRMGILAVALAYIGALAVLLAVLIVSLKILAFSEGQAAFLSLLGVSVYYGCLWLIRHRIENKVHFTITKQ